MKSRLSIILALALGMMLSTAGAGLAVSGFASGNNDASVAQYGEGDVGGQGGVLPEQSGGGDSDVTPAGGGEETLQPSRQAEAGVQSTGGEQLPFTGFAAIPILIGGVALLSTGLIMRRRTKAE